MKSNEFIVETWSQKYKSSINCSHPKGFSQKAHCAGKKKHNESVDMEMVCEDCGMCETHGNIMEIKKGQKDSNGYTKCWPGKHAEGTKKSAVTGKQVRNCVPNESIAEENKGLYYNVNKRKKSGTSRDADSPKAPTAQAWKDAAKTAKKESVAEGEVTKTATGLKHRATDKYGAGNDEPHHYTGGRSGFSDPGKYARDLEHVNKQLVKDLDADMGISWKNRGTKGVEVDEKDLTESVYSLEQAHAIFDDFEQAMAERGLTEDIFNFFTDEEIILETAAWRRSAGKSKKGGLNAKGVASYRRENPGSKLQMAVTTKPSKLKPGSKAAKRRKSFCARMGGVKGPMKKPNGKPTRKALALRKWNC